ncbi:hypothetical protein [Roseburia sp. 1XD42-69]|uniref:hypothetical protein n=1 Tax=Roseburia sp. 1XD42-69 TaxID=2320088 RepID=UPI000EA0B09D|nr:hypothetical protein [Roseburia sp. 1XD42-69]RKJ62165.1 hypothetical protein D7Y06_18095 [Roseburia sp. 1XD42-69]
MNTTELFDFYFVNRENERNALKNFMSDANNVFLWIVDIILEFTVELQKHCDEDFLSWVKPDRDKNRYVSAGA